MKTTADKLAKALERITDMLNCQFYGDGSMNDVNIYHIKNMILIAENALSEYRKDMNYERNRKTKCRNTQSILEGV